MGRRDGPFCLGKSGRCLLCMGLFSRFFCRPRQRASLQGLPPPFPPAQIPFSNRSLTMISVWLGAERRADSPRFDTLAGEAGFGFGRATHAT